MAKSGGAFVLAALLNGAVLLFVALAGIRRPVAR
jgi:hypothetical protein